MDPIVNSIVAALAAGAVAATQDVATDAIKSAYQGLKSLLARRFAKAAPFVEALEESAGKQEDTSAEEAMLRKQLAGTGEDRDVAEAARALLTAIEAERDNPAIQPLFDFDTLRAKSFELDIESSSPVMRARSATFEGDFKAKVRQPGGPSQKHGD